MYINCMDLMGYFIRARRNLIAACARVALCVPHNSVTPPM